MRSVNHADQEILIECYNRSLALLKKNSGPMGINAASKSKKAEGRYYASIFGRDAAICSLGMIVSGDRELITSAKKSLLTLAKFQAPNGQIPKFVQPEKNEADFWYAGCIDATLWWLIAIDFYARFLGDSSIRTRLNKKIEKALYWLHCQEHQNLFLLIQNEASDWADIMPRSGFVLYSNVLWYHVKKIYDVPNIKKTRYYFKHIFAPFTRSIPNSRRARILTHYVKKEASPTDFYLSFVNLSFWGPDLDVFANILSMLFGLSSISASSRKVQDLIKLKINKPCPVKVVHHPIRQNSPLWRNYMSRHKQNFPYQYHNGGIWPFVAGFWIMLLHKLKKHVLAREELERYARACSVNNWEFNEWLHGKSGKPMGMAGQSWNAAMFILAYHCLLDNVEIPMP